MKKFEFVMVCLCTIVLIISVCYQKECILITKDNDRNYLGYILSCICCYFLGFIYRGIKSNETD